MLKLASKIPFYWGFRYLGFPRILPVNLTFSVTGHCNSRCQTCKIWEMQKSQGDDLSVNEYEKIFQSLGTTPYWVTLSGGEPFLRKDLDKICAILAKICRPSIINIPTNGLLSAVIPNKVEEILDSVGSKTKLVINLSLDGIGEKHDEIRGVKGNFEKSIETYNELRKIKNLQFTLGVHTVISKFNVTEIPEIYNYVEDSLKPDQYITEIAEQRVELGTLDENLSPSINDYTKAVDFLCSKIKKKKFTGLAKVTEAFRLEYYEMVKWMLREQRRPIPCYAGFASGQVSSDGEVWGCCIKAESMGNLREADYDFKKIWFSKKGNEIRSHVRHDGCFCPLANASYTNMLLHPPTLAKVSWRFLVG
ncbi:MAG: radical SAM protein [Candidatus Altiarchaeota archaeon]